MEVCIATVAARYFEKGLSGNILKRDSCDATQCGSVKIKSL